MIACHHAAIPMSEESRSSGMSGLPRSCPCPCYHEDEVRSPDGSVKTPTALGTDQVARNGGEGLSLLLLPGVNGHDRSPSLRETLEQTAHQAIQIAELV